MLELAATSRNILLKNERKKFLALKTPSSDPAITLLIGAPGQENLLGKKINNSVSISTDAVIAENMPKLWE